MPLPSLFRSLPSSLGLKLGLLLAAILLLSLAALVTVQKTQHRAVADLLASETHERSSTLTEALELTTRPLKDFAGDYAQWDEMVRFVGNANREWAAINLDASIARFNLSAMWVLRVDGSLVYATRGEGIPDPPPLPLPTEILHRLLAGGAQQTFYFRLPDRLVELSLAPVQPSSDTRRVTKPLGWLLVEQTWDAARTRLLSRLIHCTGHPVPPGQPLPEEQPNEFTLRQPLLGLDGTAVADFVYTIRSNELEIIARSNRITTFLLGANGLIMMVLAIGALRRWVLGPLGAIRDSLASNDRVPVATLTRRTDLMGQLARLVESSFTQRAELERGIAERARLGRELHDGVIQTVYATGMNLAGIRGVMRTDPAEAERMIDGARAALNTTIRDLREFIGGLEAEVGPKTRFSDDVRSIVNLMQSVRPIGFTLQIDDALAERLGPPVRLHVLQIIREGVSNCARHSQARTVDVLLRAEEARALLEICDDGGGLAPGSNTGEGRGLANLADRTRELGGVLRLESIPSKGLRLVLSFPLPEASP